MRKVKYTTTITPITQEGPLKPRSPIYMIINDGDWSFHINNLKLDIRKTFSINASAIVAQFLMKGVPVENTTTYQITFDPIPDYTTSKISGKLVEVFIKLVDE